MLVGKVRTVWLVGGGSLLIISILMEVIGRLVYPNFYTFFGLVTFPLLVMGALAISKTLELKLRVRVFVVGFAVLLGLSGSNLGRNWALQQLTANNFKLDLSVFANHGSGAALMSGLGLLIGVLVVLVWVCVNLWSLLSTVPNNSE
jgi:hypothetical protein